MTETEIAIGDEVSAIIRVSGRITSFSGDDDGVYVDIDLTDWVDGAVGTSRIRGIPISQIQQVHK